jgi:hypothetical protein
MTIQVNYEDTDVATALDSIIKHPNKDEFVKLLTPMLCDSAPAINYFFKLMIGNKLPEVISSGTLCYLPLKELGYVSDKDAIAASDLVNDAGEVMVTVREFRGFNQYSPYIVTYTNIKDGTRVLENCYVSSESLRVIDEI